VKLLAILTCFCPHHSGDIAANVTSDAHNAVARKLASASMVLLKNTNGVLPLDPSKISNLALIGTPAVQPTTGGGGSGSVSPPYIISPLDGITRRMKKQEQAKPAAVGASCGAPAYPDMDIQGSDLLEPPAKLATSAACCQLCSTTAKCVAYSYYKGDGSCYLKSQELPRTPKKGQDVGVMAVPTGSGITYDDGQDLKKSAQVAAMADVAIVFASTKSGVKSFAKSFF
jgi:beta-glucosidase-like glycosyl hydrolase